MSGPLRLSVRLLAVTVVMAGLGACGDSEGSSASQAEIKAFAKDLSSSELYSKKAATCIATKVLNAVSESFRKKITKSDIVYGDLTAAEQDLIEKAMDSCTTAEDLATAVAKAMGTSGTAADCVVEALTKDYPKAGALFSVLNKDQTVISAAAAECSDTPAE